MGTNSIALHNNLSNMSIPGIYNPECAAIFVAAFSKDWAAIDTTCNVLYDATLGFGQCSNYCTKPDQEDKCDAIQKMIADVDEENILVDFASFSQICTAGINSADLIPPLASRGYASLCPRS